MCWAVGSLTPSSTRIYCVLATGWALIRGRALVRAWALIRGNTVYLKTLNEIFI